MSWSVTVLNNSSNTVIQPSSSIVYTQGFVAIVAVVGVGSIYLLDVGAQKGGPRNWGVLVSSGSYSATWYYDGEGACTLTINNDNTFSLTGQGQGLVSSIGPPYLPVINLPANLAISVNAFTNAMYSQRLVVTPNNYNGLLQWSGSGEGNAPIATNAPFTVPGNSGVVQTLVSIDYSEDGSNWGHSNISPPSQCAVRRFNQVIFVSEDSIDNDWNDMTALFSWWTDE